MQGLRHVGAGGQAQLQGVERPLLRALRVALRVPRQLRRVHHHLQRHQGVAAHAAHVVLELVSAAEPDVLHHLVQLLLEEPEGLQVAGVQRVLHRHQLALLPLRAHQLHQLRAAAAALLALPGVRGLRLARFADRRGGRRGRGLGGGALQLVAEVAPGGLLGGAGRVPVDPHLQVGSQVRVGQSRLSHSQQALHVRHIEHRATCTRHLERPPQTLVGGAEVVAQPQQLAQHVLEGRGPESGKHQYLLRELVI
mmetsp:Transcript_18115/g.24841  ORF Transcript_18115/g.24841 Transcript_18115/m.24841 type:complete len:252 (-) Transcript_18115:583-1338(-)